MEEFNYLWVLFIREGRMGCEIDGWAGEAFAVLCTLCQSFVVNRGLSSTIKLLTSWSKLLPSPMVMNECGY